MNDQVRNALIAKLMAEGNTLADVQRLLKDEHDVVLTYLELKMIALDLEVDWTQYDKAKPEEAEEESEEGSADEDGSAEGADPEAASDEEEAIEPPGFTTVNVSKIVRPGSAISGDVTFKSGAKAEWSLDQMGRLGLNPKNDLQPDEDDLRDFEAELRRALQV